MGDAILGNRLSGILDALASSTDTIALALSLLLPYAGPILERVSWFIWWGLLASIVWTSGKILFRQANGQELAGKLGLGVALLVCFYQVPAGDGKHQLPLASYLTIEFIELIDANYRSGIDLGASKLSRNDGRLPISMIRTLNTDNLNSVNNSRLAPIVSDYIANCTIVTQRPGPDSDEPLEHQQWRSVGLLGAGTLGFNDSDYQSESGFQDFLGFFGLESTGGANLSDQRSEPLKMLNQTPLPQNTRAYRFPTAKYWDAMLNQKAQSSIPDRKIKLPEEARFLSTHDYTEYERTGIQPADLDLTKWYADDCYELWWLSHQGTSNYLNALQVSYQEVFRNNNWKVDDQDALAAGGAAVGEAMRNFYNRSANIETGGNGPGSQPVGAFVSEESGPGAKMSSNGWSMVMGGINDLAAMLLNIGLDQAIITMLGTMSLAIAFLAVIFPIFALIAPISGGQAIVLPLKTMLMLELTLMLSYAIATVGMMLVSALNVVAVNSKFSAYGLSEAVTAMTVTVMTAMFIFPLFAAKLAHILVFGSRGVKEADGKTVSTGKQAALAATVARTVAALVGGKGLGGLANAGKAVGGPVADAAKGSSGSGGGSSAAATGMKSTTPTSTPTGSQAGGGAQKPAYNRGSGKVATPNRRGKGLNINPPKPKK